MAHINKLFKSLVNLGGMTMVSRVLGFMRDVALSALLGASPVMDAFLIAFRFPNIFRSLFAEGAFSAAFVPRFVLLKKKSKGNKKLAITFASGVGIKLFLALSLVTGVVIIFMPQIMWLVAPGFRDDPSRVAMVVSFARISFPYLLAMSLAALFAGVLQSHGIFWRGGLAASFLNISLIAAVGGIMVARGNYQDMMPDSLVGKILCVAVLLSGVWQAWYMWRGVKRLYPDYLRQGNLASIWRTNQQQIVTGNFLPDEKRLLKTMTPSMVGAGGQQLNSLVSDMIATTVGVGAVTHLFYADRLIQLPLGVIGIALGVVLLQRFSNAQHDGAAGKKELQPLLQQGICLGLAFTIPCALALHFLSIHFISFMFERGAFDSLASERTASALSVFAFALPFYILNKVFQPYFYAKGDTKTPVLITLLSFVINGTVALLLTRMGMAEKGIAIASFVAAFFTSAVFIIILFYQAALPRRLQFWWPVLLLFLMNIPLLLFYYFLPAWLAAMGGLWEKNWLLVMVAMVGSAIYYAPALWLYRDNFYLRKAR